MKNTVGYEGFDIWKDLKARTSLSCVNCKMQPTSPLCSINMYLREGVYVITAESPLKISTHTHMDKCPTRAANGPAEEFWARVRN